MSRHTARRASSAVARRARPLAAGMMWTCLTSAAGCAPAAAPSVAALVGVAPLDALGHVRLGMSAQELRRARPGVAPAPYAGYAEALGGGRVLYEFSGAGGEGTVQPPSGRLIQVVYERPTAAEADPWAAWARAVRAITGDGRGGVPACARVAGYTGRAEGRAAVWRRGRALVAVEASAPVPGPGASVAQRGGPAASLRVRVGQRSLARELWSAASAGVGVHGDPRPCPTDHASRHA